LGGEEMNKLETVRFSKESSENKIMKNDDAPLEYCDACFIALGSQEKRIFKGRKKFHLDCKGRGKLSV
jgi:hypothetical protein